MASNPESQSTREMIREVLMKAIMDATCYEDRLMAVQAYNIFMGVNNA